MLANITASFFIVFVLIFLGIALITVLGRYFSLWFQAFVSGAPISLFNIVGIAMRKIPPRLIVNTRINLCKAALKNITVADLETPYLAGGHLNEVMHALIAADKANIDLDWRRAAAIDLAYVASGKFDGFWEIGLKPWDMAAGVILITEAGGTITDFWDKPNYMSSLYVIASNSKIHESIGEIIREGFPFYSPI